ncbi:hypothetical protein [Actinomadura sp. WMMB 499]|uniref:hypothetical protein n=1 Tax=Actinomadura sp. WMMB 499 TaxID=1219491 RepID=UPI001C3F7E72|nr:hypothetical protein [Actinomadura sp. WMMB 499]
MLITADEVSVQTRETYTAEDLDRVNSFIQNVTDAIEVYCRRTFSDPAPGAVKAVALLEVRRLLNSEPGVSTERIADLSTGYAYGGGAVLLSNSAKADLRAYLRWKRPGVGSIRVFSPYYLSSLTPPVVEAPTAATGPGDILISGRTCKEGLVQVQYSVDGIQWDDVVYTQSADISDGGAPYWQAIFPAPVESGVYRWRARLNYDGDVSKWSLAVKTSYTAV